MPVLPAPAGATHELDGARFRSLCTPSRGGQARMPDGTAFTPPWAE